MSKPLVDQEQKEHQVQKNAKKIIFILALFTLNLAHSTVERKPAAGPLSYYQCEVQRETNFEEEYPKSKTIDFMISLPQSPEETQSASVNQRWIDIQMGLDGKAQMKLQIKEWALKATAQSEQSLKLSEKSEPLNQFDHKLTANLDNERKVDYTLSCTLIL